MLVSEAYKCLILEHYLLYISQIYVTRFTTCSSLILASTPDLEQLCSTVVISRLYLQLLSADVTSSSCKTVLIQASRQALLLIVSTLIFEQCRATE